MTLARIPRRPRALVARTLPLSALALTALAALPASAQTANDALRFADRSPVVGLRAAGMAGVSAFGLPDAAALLTNPAGLGFLATSFVGGSFTGSVTRSDAGYRVGAVNAGDGTAEATATRLGSLVYAGRVPTVRGALVFAIGLQQTAAYDRARDLSAETDATSLSFSIVDRALADYTVDGGVPTFRDRLARIGYEGGIIDYRPGDTGNTFSFPFYTATLPNTTVGQSTRIDDGGASNELTTAAAFEVAPGIMLGGAVGFTFGHYRYAQRFVETDVNDQNTAADYTLTVDGAEYRGFQSAELRESYRDRMAGVNARLGIAVRPQGLPIRLGLGLETPTVMEVRETYSTVLTTTFDDRRELRSTDFDADLGAGEFTFRVRTPARVTAGAAVYLGPALVGVDVEAVDWSSARFDAPDDPGYFDATNDDIRDGLRTTVSTRVGGELSLGRLALRAGYAYQPDAREEQTFSGQPSERERHTTTLGASVRLAPRTLLDLGFATTTLRDEFEPYVDEQRPVVISDRLARGQISLGLRVGL